MSEPARTLPDIDDAMAETKALAAAVEEARADQRAVPHAEMKAWLLDIAAGDFEVPPPQARFL